MKYKTSIEHQQKHGLDVYIGTVKDAGNNIIYMTQSWSPAGCLTQIRRWWHCQAEGDM